MRSFVLSDNEFYGAVSLLTSTRRRCRRYSSAFTLKPR